jgi:hypothetical protein
LAPTIALQAGFKAPHLYDQFRTKLFPKYYIIKRPIITNIEITTLRLGRPFQNLLILYLQRLIFVPNPELLSK